MDNIILENLRCFQKNISPPIKPLTILVGENSTGKSTFMATMRLAWDLCSTAPKLNFNEEPFLLGSYDQIALYRGGRAGRARSFVIGAQINLDPNSLDFNSQSVSREIKVYGKFINEASQPHLAEWSFNAKPYIFNIQKDLNDNSSVASVTTPSSTVKISGIPIWFLILPGSNAFNFLKYILTDQEILGKNVSIEGEKPSDDDLNVLISLGNAFYKSLGSRPYALSPIRSRPLRTYDILTDSPSPEGTHVPLILANSSTSPEEWKNLKRALIKFGELSGLFSEVDVRRMGRKDSDPFQIRVKISGPYYNLVDVGYGVSQILPIIVDALQESNGTTYLLQQPEIHLHPKAQVAFISVISRLSMIENKRFIIETHSDYIIDRLRLLVRDRNEISSDDVTILYFERENSEVNIHRIDIDKRGNLVNTPPGYRKFFLKEEMRLLGGK